MSDKQGSMTEQLWERVKSFEKLNKPTDQQIEEAVQLLVTIRLRGAITFMINSREVLSQMTRDLTHAILDKTGILYPSNILIYDDIRAGVDICMQVEEIAHHVDTLFSLNPNLAITAQYNTFKVLKRKIMEPMSDPPTEHDLVELLQAFKQVELQLVITEDALQKALKLVRSGKIVLGFQLSKSGKMEPIPKK
jgi:hypothetical protein